MRFVNLPKLTTGVPFFDRALEVWKEAIERANNWSMTGNVGFQAGEGGFAVNIRDPIWPSGSIPAVSITEITPAPSADKMGQGVCMTRSQDGEDLTDDQEMVVYSNFTKGVPSGTRLMVTINRGGDSCNLVGADCPTIGV